jgi:hypothetical protein
MASVAQALMPRQMPNAIAAGRGVPAPAATTPFFWQGNQAVSAAELERQRKISDALRPDKAPTGPWSLLGDLADEGVATYRDSKASAAEKAAQQSVADALAKGDYESVVANDMATPQQSAVAQALWQQQMHEKDPDTLLDRQLKEAQIEKTGAEINAEPKRNIQNDANGVPRYIDTGEPVYPTDVPKPDDTPPYNGDQFKGESGLRQEYNNLNTTKDFGLQTQAYQRVLSSAKDPSAAGDLALIFNYMKVLDPGSTVREGEFATAQNSGSLPERIWSQYNKIMSGERLTPDIRKDFVKRAGDLFKGASDVQGSINKRYGDLATHYNFNPDNILNPIPSIGVLDPKFNIDEYLTQTPDGKVTQTKPLPVTNDQDYQAIPQGAQYVDPEGNVRVKQ